MGASHTCRRTRKRSKRPSASTFWLFLPHFCLQNPYLWVVLENLVDALQIMHYPPSASTSSFSSNALVCQGKNSLSRKMICSQMSRTPSLPRCNPIEWVNGISTTKQKLERLHELGFNPIEWVNVFSRYVCMTGQGMGFGSVEFQSHRVGKW